MHRRNASNWSEYSTSSDEDMSPAHRQQKVARREESPITHGANAAPKRTANELTIQQNTGASTSTWNRARAMSACELSSAPLTQLNSTINYDDATARARRASHPISSSIRSITGGQGVLAADSLRLNSAASTVVQRNASASFPGPASVVGQNMESPTSVTAATRNDLPLDLVGRSIELCNQVRSVPVDPRITRLTHRSATAATAALPDRSAATAIASGSQVGSVETNYEASRQRMMDTLAKLKAKVESLENDIFKKMSTSSTSAFGLESTNFFPVATYNAAPIPPRYPMSLDLPSFAMASPSFDPFTVLQSPVAYNATTSSASDDEIDQVPNTGNDSVLLVKFTMKYVYESAQQNGNSDDIDAAESCTVCTKPFENGELVRRLPCFHLFHTACVDDWLNKNRDCPLCRVRIDTLNKFE